MIDKNRRAKNLWKRKKIIPFLDKRKEIMKNTKFKVEDIFHNIVSEKYISNEQIAILDTFSAKIIGRLIFVKIYIYLNLEKRK